MRCDNCGMIYKGSESTCPRCGVERLNEKNGLLNKKFMINGQFECTFRQIYLFFAINVLIISFVVNMLVSIKQMWFLIPAAIVATSYFTIAILSDPVNFLKYFRKCVLSLVIMFLLMQFFLFKGGWAIDYIIPIIIIVSDCLLFFAFFLLKNKISSIILTALQLTIISIPFFVLYCLGLTSGTEFSKILILSSFALSLTIFINLGMYLIYLLKNRVQKYVK